MPAQLVRGRMMLSSNIPSIPFDWCGQSVFDGPTVVDSPVELCSGFNPASGVLQPIGKAFGFPQPGNQTVGAAVPGLLRDSCPPAVGGFVSFGVVDSINGQSDLEPVLQGPVTESVEVGIPLRADDDMGVVLVVAVTLPQSVPDGTEGLGGWIGTDALCSMDPTSLGSTISLEATTGACVATAETEVEDLQSVAAVTKAVDFPAKITFPASYLGASEYSSDCQSVPLLSDLWRCLGFRHERQDSI